MSPRYIALIGDAAASRALPPRHRGRLQQALRGAIPQFNRRWRTSLAARFAVTLGDEFQVLLTTARPVWEILHEVHFRFPDVAWVVACGLGAVATRLEPRITAPEVDGPCFHAARAALQHAKRRRQLVAFGGFPPGLEPLASYYSALYWSWTPRQRRAATLLLVEAAVVIVALTVGTFLAPLVVPRAQGLFWGRIGLLATGYLYVCGRGMVIIRAVLELPTLQMRRDEDRTAGAIEISRGRAIGALERALALTLVLLGQYAAVGWIIAAKSLARFKALEDREFAEYFLIGTLASFLLALLGGIGMQVLLR